MQGRLINVLPLVFINVSYCCLFSGKNVEVLLCHAQKSSHASFSWGGPIVHCHWPIVKFCEYNPLVPFKWIYMNCCTSIHNGCDVIIALLPEKCLHWCVGTSPLSRPQKTISYVLSCMIIQMFTQNICKKL